MKLIFLVLLVFSMNSFAEGKYELRYNLNKSNKGVWIFENVYALVHSDTGMEKVALSTYSLKDFCRILTKGLSTHDYGSVFSYHKTGHNTYIPRLDEAGNIIDMKNDFHIPLDSFSCEMNETFDNYTTKTVLPDGILFKGLYFNFKEKIHPLVGQTVPLAQSLCSIMVGYGSRLVEAKYSKTRPDMTNIAMPIYIAGTMGGSIFRYIEQESELVLESIKCSH